MVTKVTGVVSDKGEYDVLGYLLNNYPITFISTQASADTTVTVYTVPSGKKAYVLSAYVYAQHYTTVTNKRCRAQLRVYDPDGNIVFILAVHAFVNDSNAIPHFVTFEHFNGIIKLDSGYSIKLYTEGNDGSSTVALIET